MLLLRIPRNRIGFKIDQVSTNRRKVIFVAHPFSIKECMKVKRRVTMNNYIMLKSPRKTAQQTLSNIPMISGRAMHKLRKLFHCKGNVWMSEGDVRIPPRALHAWGHSGIIFLIL